MSLLVEDPNGVRFEFPTARSLSTRGCAEHGASSSWKLLAGSRSASLYFRTFDGGDPRSGNYALEAGGESEGNFRVRRASHVIVSSLTFEYARIVQLYESTSVRLESLDLLATPMQVLSSSNCSIDRLKVENYITRGKTFEWHQAGSGTSASISADSTGTSLRHAIIVRGWTGWRSAGPRRSSTMFRSGDFPTMVWRVSWPESHAQPASNLERAGYDLHAGRPQHRNSKSRTWSRPSTFETRRVR